MKNVLKLILIFSLSVVLIACNSKKETPKEAVDNGLAAVKNLDIKNAKRYFDLSNVEDEDILEENDLDLTNLERKQLEAVKLYLDKFEYQTLAEEVNGDRASVVTKIETIEMKSLFVDYFSYALQLAFSNISEEEIDEKLEDKIFDLLNSGDIEIIESEVTFNLNKKDEQWKIVLDQDTLDALLGGIISAANNFEN